MDDDALPKMARDLLANMSLLSSSHVDMSIPNMFHYLPHLIGKPDSIMPAVKYSQGRAGGKLFRLHAILLKRTTR